MMFKRMTACVSQVPLTEAETTKILIEDITMPNPYSPQSSTFNYVEIPKRQIQAAYMYVAEQGKWISPRGGQFEGLLYDPSQCIPDEGATPRGYLWGTCPGTAWKAVHTNQTTESIRVYGNECADKWPDKGPGELLLSMEYNVGDFVSSHCLAKLAVVLFWPVLMALDFRSRRDELVDQRNFHRIVSKKMRVVSTGLINLLRYALLGTFKDMVPKPSTDALCPLLYHLPLVSQLDETLLKTVGVMLWCVASASIFILLFGFVLSCWPCCCVRSEEVHPFLAMGPYLFIVLATLPFFMIQPALLLNRLGLDAFVLVFRVDLSDNVADYAFLSLLVATCVVFDVLDRIVLGIARSSFLHSHFIDGCLERRKKKKKAAHIQIPSSD
jgi:hypothetical protein